MRILQQAEDSMNDSLRDSLCHSIIASLKSIDDLHSSSFAGIVVDKSKKAGIVAFVREIDRFGQFCSNASRSSFSVSLVAHSSALI